MLSKFGSHVRHKEGMRSMVKATAAALAVGIALLLPLPASAAVRHGPDLQVKYLSFKPAPPRAIVEHDGTAHFTLRFTLVNAGDRPAAASEVGASIVGSHTQLTKSVPALGPRSSRSYTMGANGYDWKLVKAGTGLGLRKVGVCADVQNDVQETNAYNNCSKLVDFRAVPRTWLVNTFTRSGEADRSRLPSMSFYKVSTSAASNMRFDFDALVRDASTGERSLVWLAVGTVEETQSGHGGYSDDFPDGCDSSGQGSVTHSPWDYIAGPLGSLEVSFQDMDTYRAVLAEGASYTYPVTGPCVNSYDYMKDLETHFEDFASQATVQNGRGFDFGQGAEPSGDYLTTWSFKADVPGGSG